MNRLKAAEQEKTDLEGAKDEAEYYLSLQDEKALKQHTIFSKFMYTEGWGRGGGGEGRGLLLERRERGGGVQEAIFDTLQRQCHWHPVGMLPSIFFQHMYSISMCVLGNIWVV